MKNIAKLFLAIFLVYNFVSCTSQTNKKPNLKTKMDTVSYAMGLWIATGPANVPSKNDLDVDLIAKGITDGLVDQEQMFDQAEALSILQRFSTEEQAVLAEKQQAEAESNRLAGIQFLEENKEKEGVVTTASGLQYRVIKEGSGPRPTASDKVKVHYKGTLINGEEFDSSYERGEPITFALNQVISGWTAGLQLMNEGSVYELYIPQDLAYGAQARGDKIQPYSTLIFEIELLEVNPAE